MTHEGRLARGEENHKRGFMNSETEYFLANKPKEEKPKKVKEAKDGSSK